MGDLTIRSEEFDNLPQVEDLHLDVIIRDKSVSLTAWGYETIEIAYRRAGQAAMKEIDARLKQMEKELEDADAQD